MNKVQKHTYLNVRLNLDRACDFQIERDKFTGEIFCLIFKTPEAKNG